MEEFEKKLPQEKIGKDITAEFMSLDPVDFVDFLRGLRSEVSLIIKLDLTGINDQEQFIWLVRRAKVFMEKPKNQERKASVRCTRTQMDWDDNAFQSGVVWEEVK